MAHLYKLGLENFRVFKELSEIEFAPITIFTGANNSGKSSVVKAIQLLKNNLASKNYDSDLNLSFVSGDHNLSNFTDIVNDPEKPLKFVLPTVMKGNDDILSITLSYNHNKNSELGEGRISCIELHTEKNKLVFKYEVVGNTRKVYTDYKYFYKKISQVKNNLSYFNKITLKTEERNFEFNPYPLLVNENKGPKQQIGSDDFNDMIKRFNKTGMLFPQLFLMLLITSGKIDLEKWTEYYSNSYLDENDKERIIYSYLEIETDLSVKQIEKLKKQFENNLLNFLSSEKEKEVSKVTPFINHFEYNIYECCPHQSQIEAIFLGEIFKAIPLDKRETLLMGIYSKDEKLVKKTNFEFFFQEYILNNISMILKNTGLYFQRVSKLDSVRANTQRLYTYNSQGTAINSLLLLTLKRNLKNGRNEIAFLNKWLNNFGVKGELEILNSQPGVGISITVGGRPLADLGYGLTQLVPILLEIVLQGSSFWDEMYINDPYRSFHTSSTIIIEEPETNLHPRYQSLLADLFVDAKKQYNIQFVIETHSEYLIRKLQYLTGKGDLKPADTSLYYFYHPNEIPENEKQVKKIEIQEDGSLSSDFGAGFFDEALNWKFELLKLKNKN